MRDLCELAMILERKLSGEVVLPYILDSQGFDEISSTTQIEPLFSEKGFDRSDIMLQELKGDFSMFDRYIAMKKVLKWEGGYVNDPDDSGGETIFGISRVNWPTLNLWSLVDEYKSVQMEVHKMEDNVFDLCKGEIVAVYEKFLNSADTIPCSDQDEYNGIVAFLVNAGRGHTDRLAKLKNTTARKEYVLNHYRRVIANSPRKAKYKKGWTNRVRDTFQDWSMQI